jgi:hypothetical protein
MQWHWTIGDDAQLCPKYSLVRVVTCSEESLVNSTQRKILHPWVYYPKLLLSVTIRAKISQANSENFKILSSPPPGSDPVLPSSNTLHNFAHDRAPFCHSRENRRLYLCNFSPLLNVLPVPITGSRCPKSSAIRNYLVLDISIRISTVLHKAAHLFPVKNHFCYNLLVVYLKSLSVAQSTRCPVEWRLVNNNVDMICNESMVA